MIHKCLNSLMLVLNNKRGLIDRSIDFILWTGIYINGIYYSKGIFLKTANEKATGKCTM